MTTDASDICEAIRKIGEETKNLLDTPRNIIIDQRSLKDLEEVIYRAVLKSLRELRKPF